MKIAILSDLHWGVRNNSQFFLDRMEEFYYGQFIPYLVDNKIDTVWILGDFFENRKMIGVPILNRALNFLEELSNSNIKVYMILGNHDVVYKNTNELTSVIPVTKLMPNVIVIPKHDIIEFDGLRVGFISWLAPEFREEAICWIRNVDVSVICGHFEINNFEMVRGVVCSSGLEPYIFERFDRVLSGHFHVRGNNGVIQYLGNPYQTNWGETHDDHGFHIFDTQTKELEFVKNPIDIFKIVVYNDTFNLDEFDIEDCRNRIVRVFATLKGKKSKTNLELLTEMLTNVSYNVEVIEEREAHFDDTDSVNVTDTMELIKQYVDSFSLEHIDRGLLDKMLIDIYKDSLELEKSVC